MIKQRVSVGTLEKQSLRAASNSAEDEYDRRQTWKLQRQARANRNLLLFSSLILLLPLGIYFASLWGYFGPGKEVWAALCAVIAANVVLVGYVTVAMIEPDEMPSLPAGKQSTPASPKSSSPLYPIQEDVVAMQNFVSRGGSGEREILYMDDEHKLE